MIVQIVKVTHFEPESKPETVYELRQTREDTGQVLVLASDTDYTKIHEKYSKKKMISSDIYTEEVIASFHHTVVMDA